MANQTDHEEGLIDAPFSSSTNALLEHAGPSYTQAYRESISLRIHELEREIRALQAQQNVVAFPNLLPPELLSHIFLIIARRGPVKPGASNRKASWITVTHVCRHWRSVALDCGSLWSDLTFFNPRFTKMMLERSKDSPLSLDFNPSQPNDTRFDKILTQILSHENHRLIAVDLTGSRLAPRFPALLEKLGAHAPILLTLCIDGCNQSGELPKVFDLGGAPRLRELKLRNLGLRWDSIPVGPKLKKLDLSASITSPKVIWGDLVKALDQVPSLEQIELSGFLPDGPPPSLLTSTPTTLPRLKHAVIRGCTPAVEGILSCVRVPRSASMLLYPSISPEMVEQGGVDGLLSRLKESSTREDFFVRSFHVFAESLFEVGFWDSADTQSVPVEERHLLNPRFGLAVLSFDRFSVHSRSLNAIATSFITQFDFQSLTYLSLWHTGIMEQPVFETVLARLPGIEEILLRNLQITTLLHLLIHDTGNTASIGREGLLENLPRSAASHRSRPLYFPGLKTMALRDIDFDREGNMLNSLIDALKSRPEGWRIAKVAIEMSKNVGRGEVGRLQSACSNLTVIWDGYNFFPLMK